MLKLDLSLAPRWVDVGAGVRLLVAPVTSSVLAEARGAPEVAEAVARGNGPLISHRYGKRIAALTISAWEGVGDAEGNPVDPSPAWIEALFEHRRDIADAFMAEVMAPIMALEAEKNALSASPNGTSATAGRNTAVPAKASARTARAGSSPRKPSKAGRSGI